MKSLEGRNRLGLKRPIALDKMRLARVYQGMERITLSRQYAEEARDIFNRLNMTEEYAKAGMFLENLPE